MANKTKILNQAQKHIGKGQWDKAIRELQKLIAEEPNDVRTLLKLGDVYSKQGDRESATRVYRQVAESYSEQGFFLKAVAVFKQILKHDPKNIEVLLRLAELYEHLNLTGEALSQYHAAAALYEEQGNAPKSLEVLRRVVGMEPQNVASRIKLAERFSKENMVEDAAQEFSQAAELLKQQNRIDDFLKVAERLLYHAPDRLDVVQEVAKMLLARNDTKRGLAKLQILYKDDPKDVETLRLLARAFSDLGQSQKTLFVFRELARVHHEQGRPVEAVQVYQQILQLNPSDPEALQAVGANGGPGSSSRSGPPMAPGSSGPVPASPASPTSAPGSSPPGWGPSAPAPAAPPTAPASHGRVGPGVPAAPPPVAPGSAPPSTGRVPTDDLPLVGPSLSPRPPPPAGPRSGIPPPPPPKSADLPDEELDFGGLSGAPPEPAEPARSGPSPSIEQILTETDVFVRYGLREKALEHLQKGFELDPENISALEKMRDIYKAANDPSRAAEAVASIVQICGRQGKMTEGDRYRTELAELAPGHPLAAGAPEDGSAEPISIDITEDSGIFDAVEPDRPPVDVQTVAPAPIEAADLEPDPFAGALLDDAADAGGLGAVADLDGPHAAGSDPLDGLVESLENDPNAGPPPAAGAEAVRIPDSAFEVAPPPPAGASPAEGSPSPDRPEPAAPGQPDPLPSGVLLLEELEAADAWPAEFPLPPKGRFEGDGPGPTTPPARDAPAPDAGAPLPPELGAEALQPVDAADGFSAAPEPPNGGAAEAAGSEAQASSAPETGFDLGEELAREGFSLLSTDLDMDPLAVVDPGGSRDPGTAEPKGAPSPPGGMDGSVPAGAEGGPPAAPAKDGPSSANGDEDPFGAAAMRLGGSLEAMHEAPTQHLAASAGPAFEAKEDVETEGDISDELDEAEFMMEAGLQDEARDLLTELRVRVPGSSRAQALWSRLERGGLDEPTEPLAPVDGQAPRGSDPPSGGENPFARPSPVDAAGQPSGQVTADIAAHVEAMIEEGTEAPPSEHSFDQGMMYKELGRLDDAVREFRAAARSERRAIDSLEMIGHCLVDKDEPKAAIECFKLALKKGARGPAATNLKYEIGAAYERLNDLPRAKDWYQACHRDDPEHRDVEVRLESVQARGAGPPGGPRSSNKNKISYL